MAPSMGICNTPATLWRMCKSLPRHHKAFLIVVMLQTLIVTAHRIQILVDTTIDINDPNSTYSGTETVEDRRADARWSFTLITVSAWFVLYFAVHAVLFANSFELFAFLAASVLLLIRILLEYLDRNNQATIECSGNTATTCLVMFIVTAVFNVSSWAFCIRMAGDLRWKKYKAIGANLATIRSYKVYELFVAVRKVDLQFSAIMLLTGFIFFTHKNDHAFLIPNVLIFFIECAWERFGFIGVRKENKAYMLWFFGLSVCLPAFVVVITVLSLSETTTLFNSLKDGSSGTKLAITSFLLLVNRVATVALGVALFRSFGQGYAGLRAIFQCENEKWETIQAITAGGGVKIKTPVAAGAGAGNRAPADEADLEAGTEMTEGGKKDKNKKKKNKKKKNKKKKHTRDKDATQVSNPVANVV